MNSFFQVFVNLFEAFTKAIKGTNEEVSEKSKSSERATEGNISESKTFRVREKN